MIMWLVTYNAKCDLRYILEQPDPSPIMYSRVGLIEDYYGLYYRVYILSTNREAALKVGIDLIFDSLSKKEPKPIYSRQLVVCRG